MDQNVTLNFINIQISCQSKNKNKKTLPNFIWFWEVLGCGRYYVSNELLDNLSSNHDSGVFLFIFVFSIISQGFHSLKGTHKNVMNHELNIVLFKKKCKEIVRSMQGFISKGSISSQRKENQIYINDSNLFQCVRAD